MTIVTRISTLGIHQSTLSDFSKVNADLANLQKQISSGVKTDTFEGMVGDAEQFINLEAEMQRTDRYINNNAETISRFETAFNSVGQMVDIVDEMENLIVRRNGADEDHIQFEVNLENLRESLVRELNTTFGGRFIFGGTRSNLPPVITEPSIPDAVNPGVPDANYYQGSQENIIIRPQDNFTIEFDVRADDEAFQKIMSAISLAIEGHQEDDSEKVGQAYSLIREGQDDLVGLQANIQSNSLNLELINSRHISMNTYLRGVRDTIINTDLLEASTEVAIDEAILQASFQAFARISNLNLTDFLN